MKTNLFIITCLLFILIACTKVIDTTGSNGAGNGTGTGSGTGSGTSNPSNPAPTPGWPG